MRMSNGQLVDEVSFIHAYGWRPIMGTILLVILILMLLGAIPTWPHSRSWGYAPSGSLGLIILIIVLLLITGRL